MTPTELLLPHLHSITKVCLGAAKNPPPDTGMAIVPDAWSTIL